MKPNPRELRSSRKPRSRGESFLFTITFIFPDGFSLGQAQASTAKRALAKWASEQSDGFAVAGLGFSTAEQFRAALKNAVLKPTAAVSNVWWARMERPPDILNALVVRTA